MKDLMQDDDKTVFISSTPLSELPVESAAAANIQPPSTTGVNDQSVLMGLELDYRSGINALMQCATELFFIHYQIIKGRFNEVAKVRAFIQDALLKFEMQGQQNNLPKPLIKSAKYVLCTFLDETILQTEWGKDSSWGRQTLLAQFFNETWGGATVFKIRQFCIENLHEYIDLLEMIYICLCLGFKGQYGTETNGMTLLDRIKRETYQTILEYRGDRLNLPLSPHGASNYVAETSLKKAGSLKWILAGCLGVLLLAYIGFSVMISIESSPVYARVMSVVQE